MLHSLGISGYRCFRHFEMGDLGHVNLLVGKNNTGKASVLEAICLLASRGNPSAFWQLMGRRGENIAEDRPTRRPELELDICHLFTGHEFSLGTKFTIAVRNGDPERSITCAVGKPRMDRKTDAPEFLEEGLRAAIGSRPALHLTGSPPSIVAQIPLTRRGYLSPDSVDWPNRPSGSLPLGSVVDGASLMAPPHFCAVPGVCPLLTMSDHSANCRRSLPPQRIHPERSGAAFQATREARSAPPARASRWEDQPVVQRPARRWPGATRSQRRLSRQQSPHRFGLLGLGQRQRRDHLQSFGKGGIKSRPVRLLTIYC